MEYELYHYGVKGMKWGKRKDYKENPTRVTRISGGSKNQSVPSKNFNNGSGESFKSISSKPVDKIAISPKVSKKVDQFLRTTAFSNDNTKNISNRRISETGVSVKRRVLIKAKISRKVNRFLSKNGFSDNKKNRFKNVRVKNPSVRQVPDVGKSVKNRLSKRR